MSKYTYMSKIDIFYVSRFWRIPDPIAQNRYLKKKFRKVYTDCILHLRAINLPNLHWHCWTFSIICSIPAARNKLCLPKTRQELDVKLYADENKQVREWAWRPRFDNWPLFIASFTILILSDEGIIILKKKFQNFFVKGLF